MELLVVMSIIGMLLSLLLPAIQASRESARRAVCQNHLKQLGLAMLNHESAKGCFPSGGWGFAWAGDPDRGTGLRQPGGWAYDMLPYLERGDLARLGAGLPLTKKKSALATVLAMPLDVFDCPTRRQLGTGAPDPILTPANYDKPQAIAESDYAVNGGDVVAGIGPGPGSYADGDNPAYQWPDTSKCTGICYLRSQVHVAQISDGTSNTYLIGEKYAVAGGWDPGDDQGIYAGFDYDTVRWTDGPPMHDVNATWTERFGSNHPHVCQFVFCDGSVRPISFDIDPNVHRRLGNRQDGAPIDDAEVK
jgi:type II secretory pathway pseudopilin PulG